MTQQTRNKYYPHAALRATNVHLSNRKVEVLVVVTVVMDDGGSGGNWWVGEGGRDGGRWWCMGGSTVVAVIEQTFTVELF